MLPPIIVSSIIMTIFMVVAIGTIHQSVAATMQNTGATEKRTVTVEITETVQEAAEEATEPEENESTYSTEEKALLMKMAMAEAESESVRGKALVILVVLNRVQSEDFPDTVEEVIFQKKQFSPTAEGGRYWTTEPNEDCYEALELVMSGWDESEGALYFESCKNDSWHSRNLEYLYEVGNHRFYR